jgi:hypothetical protein
MLRPRCEALRCHGQSQQSQNHPSRRLHGNEEHGAGVHPTYASWLNAIESHFFGLKKFTCQVTDDRSHLRRRKRIRDYLFWRNKEAGADSAALAGFTSIQLERH